MDELPGSTELFLFIASTAHAMKNAISDLRGTLANLLPDASPGIGKAHPQIDCPSEVAQMHKHLGRFGSVRRENGGQDGGGCFVLTLP